jgi:hypothetical protein
MHAIPDRTRHLLPIIGLATLVIGLMVLLGWVYQVPELRFHNPGLPNITANTAAGFILLGTAFFLATLRVPPSSRRLFDRTAAGFSLAALLLGALTWLQYLVATDLGIDQLIVRALSIGSPEAAPLRPAAINASALILASCALLAGLSSRLILHLVHQVFSTALLLVCLTAFFGYAFGATMLYTSSNAPQSGLAPMSLLLFLLLDLGLLYWKPDLGFMALMRSDDVGGRVTRMLLPAAIIFPMLTGLLRVQAQNWGWVSETLGAALHSIINVVFFASLVVAGAAMLRRAEEERQKVLQDLENALKKVLTGYVSICASCKNVRDEEGNWLQVERYVTHHTQAQFSHGLCPVCYARYATTAPAPVAPEPET